MSISAARFRYTLVAGSTAVVIGAGFTMVGLNKHATEVSRAGDVATISNGSGGGAPGADGQPTGYPLPDPTEASLSPSPSASSSSPAPKPSATSSKPKPKPTRTYAPKPTSKPAPPSTAGTVIDQVLAHINSERAKEGLPAYTLDTQLSKASAKHNQLMMDGCGMSHLCPGEKGIGERFIGVPWGSAGENIGAGGIGDKQQDLISFGIGMTDGMLGEKAPDDGHRQNLLSKGFKKIGLSIVRDSKGTAWMTQDFVG